MVGVEDLRAPVLVDTLGKHSEYFGIHCIEEVEVSFIAEYESCLVTSHHQGIDSTRSAAQLLIDCLAKARSESHNLVVGEVEVRVVFCP